METEQAPESDVIDDALIAIVDEIIGPEGDEEDFDAASDVVLEVIEQMVDEGSIPEMPESDASDEAKKAWVEKIPSIKEEIHNALNDGFMNSDEEDDDTNSPI
jgi:hypothetical protein